MKKLSLFLLFVFVFFIYPIEAKEIKNLDDCYTFVNNISLESFSCTNLIKDKIAEQNEELKCNLTLKSKEDMNLVDPIKALVLSSVKFPNEDIYKLSDRNVIHNDISQIKANEIWNESFHWWKGLYLTGIWNFRWILQCTNSTEESGATSALIEEKPIEVVSPSTYSNMLRTIEQTESSKKQAEISNNQLLLQLISFIIGGFLVFITGYTTKRFEWRRENIKLIYGPLLSEMDKILENVFIFYSFSSISEWNRIRNESLFYYIKEDLRERLEKFYLDLDILNNYLNMSHKEIVRITIEELRQRRKDPNRMPIEAADMKIKIEQYYKNYIDNLSYLVLCKKDNNTYIYNVQKYLDNLNQEKEKNIDSYFDLKDIEDSIIRKISKSNLIEATKKKQENMISSVKELKIKLKMETRLGFINMF